MVSFFNIFLCFVSFTHSSYFTDTNNLSKTLNTLLGFISFSLHGKKVSGEIFNIFLGFVSFNRSHISRKKGFTLNFLNILRFRFFYPYLSWKRGSSETINIKKKFYVTFSFISHPGSYVLMLKHYFKHI